jgi:hypothetical protein
MGVIKGDACVMGDNIFDYAFFMFDYAIGVDF